MRWLAAAKNTSGAELWLYSSRKWCSTFPHVVETHAICQLDLVESILEQAMFVAFAPWAGDLVLVEQAELHGGEPMGVSPTGLGREAEP